MVSLASKLFLVFALFVAFGLLCFTIYISFENLINIGVTNRLLDEFNDYDNITTDLYVNHWNVEKVALEMYHDGIYGKAQSTYDIDQSLDFNFTVGYSVVNNPCFTLLATGDKTFVNNAINFNAELIEHNYDNYSIVIDNVIYGNNISFREFTADEDSEYFGVYTRCDNFTVSYVLPTVSLDIDYIAKYNYYRIIIVPVLLICLGVFIWLLYATLKLFKISDD